jgi:hypothetical protein
MENSTDYKIDVQFTGRHSGNIGLSIMMVDLRTQETIHSSTLRGVREADDFRAILNRAPQAYFGMLVNDIFARQSQSLNKSGVSTPEYTQLVKSINAK